MMNVPERPDIADPDADLVRTFTYARDTYRLLTGIISGGECSQPTVTHRLPEPSGTVACILTLSSVDNSSRLERGER